MDLKSDWLSEFSLKETLDIAIQLARYEAERSGSFRTEILGLIDHRDWNALLNFDFRYNENRAVLDYLHARQSIAFFEKLEPLGELLGVDREAAAYAKILNSEKACRETNDFFLAHRRGKLCFTPAFEHALFAAKWKIEKTLGEAPGFMELTPKLGPGATTTVKRKNACAAVKLNTRLSCGTGFIPYLPFIPAALPHVWDHQSRKYFESPTGDEIEILDVSEEPGKLSFVTKDAKSFRSIVVEPILNSMYQLAVGEIIEQRLKRLGIDITNQGLNQSLARYGSISGALATLDLSSASDTISYELVRFLLPDDWFSLMVALRSSEAEYNGTLITLEKFSSMGNGYTFPLETLIFYALVWASSPHASRGYISCYGDDIVCGSLDAPEVIRTLEASGFEINKKKSFVEGPFRESCGADYYRGVNIRPYRMKKLVNGETLFTMYNFFARNDDRELCALIETFIHPDIKLWGPDGYGDGHLLSENPYLKPYKRDLGYGGYTFDTYIIGARKSIRRHPGDYLHVLYSVYAVSRQPRDRDDEEPTVPLLTGHRNNMLNELVRATSESVLLEEIPSIANNKGKVIKSFPSEDGHRTYKRVSVHTLRA